MRFGEHMSKVKQKSVQELLLALHEQHWASGRWGITAVASVVWLLLLSLSVVSDSLWPHGLYHTRLPCPSLSPGVCSNSCPLSRWCHPTISPNRLLLSSIFPSIRVFSNESVLRIRWPKYWSFNFSISPCNEYSELISFRMTGLIDFLVVQGTFKSFVWHHRWKESVLWHSAFFMVQLSHPYRTTGKNHSFDYSDPWKKNYD